MWILHEGTLSLPWVQDTPTSMSARTLDKDAGGQALRCVVTRRPKARKKWAARHNSLISAETWRLVDERVSARQEPGRDQQRLRRRGCDILAALKEYRRRWEATTGEDVEILLSGDNPLPRKAWVRMQECYKELADHTPPPA